MAKSHTLLSQPIRSYNRNHKKFAYSCFSRAWSWRPFFFFSSDWLKCTVFSNCFNQPFPHSAPVGSGGEQSDRVEERAWGEATFERRENEFKFTNETKSRLGGWTGSYRSPYIATISLELAPLLGVQVRVYF